MYSRSSVGPLPRSSWSRAALKEPLVNRGPGAERIADWNLYLRQDQRAREETGALRHHRRRGRPLGSESFVGRLERATGRRLLIFAEYSDVSEEFGLFPEGFNEGWATTHTAQRTAGLVAELGEILGTEIG